MEKFVSTVADAFMFVIVSVVLVSCLCALKVVLRPSVERQAFNKYVSPGFPCEGTLFVLARDGVMYAVPQDKAVVKTDMVRELHYGRVVRGCDRWGHYTYVENEYGQREHGHEESEHEGDEHHEHHEHHEHEEYEHSEYEHEGGEKYEHEEDEHREQTPGALDHVNADWSIGSVRSQAMTLSMSGDNSCSPSPPQSPLVGELMTASPNTLTI